MRRNHFVLMDSAPGAGGGGGVAVTPAGGSATQVLSGATGDVGAAAAAAISQDNQWYSGMANADVKTWVEAKGFKDPHAVAESAYNLEKLIGFDRAGRTVVLPKDDASADEVKAFRARLGVPDSPDGYKLPVPQGQSDAFAKVASAWMHEAGLTPKQAEIIAAKFNEYGTAAMAKQAADFDAAGQAEISSLRTEWGAAFDQQTAVAKRAAAQFIPGDAAARGETLTKIERAIGAGAMLKLFAAIGAGLGEHKMVQNGESGAVGVLTPAQARSRIDALKSDKAWSGAYLQGDRAKIAEMQQLHQWAYPEAAA